MPGASTRAETRDGGPPCVGMSIGFTAVERAPDNAPRSCARRPGPCALGAGRTACGRRLAKLGRVGYCVRDGDGFRELPDGKPLALRNGMTPVAADRAASEP